MGFERCVSEFSLHQKETDISKLHTWKIERYCFAHEGPTVAYRVFCQQISLHFPNRFLAQ